MITGYELEAVEGEKAQFLITLNLKDNSEKGKSKALSMIATLLDELYK
jgi:hypothetical protein